MTKYLFLALFLLQLCVTPTESGSVVSSVVKSFFEFRAAIGKSASPQTVTPTLVIHVNENPVKEIVEYFNKIKGTLPVVTFIGYSGQGYKYPERMLKIAKKQLDEYAEKNDKEEYVKTNAIVNLGATLSGIGQIYDLAREMGFVTTGIVSIEAEKYKEKYGADITFVTPGDWGGYVKGTETLHPASEAMVEVSDKIIRMGEGGDIAKVEVKEAVNRKRRTRGRGNIQGKPEIVSIIEEATEPAPNKKKDEAPSTDSEPQVKGTVTADAKPIPGSPAHNTETSGHKVLATSANLTANQGSGTKTGASAAPAG